MPQDAPGGANPFADFAQPRGALERIFTPNSYDRMHDEKHAAFNDWNTKQAETARATAAAATERERLTALGKQYGLNGRDLLSFISSGEVPDIQEITKGNTYLDGDKFKTAPMPMENVTDALGRNMTFDPNTGARGEADGPVKPVSVADAAHLVDPLTQEKVYENTKDLDPSDIGPDPTKEGVVRREFNGITRPFREVHAAYARIEATDTSTPAGQMGLIFQYMKMLDPGSTVREGEYATAQNTTGIPGQVRNLYNQVLAGKFLTDEQVNDFQTQAKSLYSAAADNYQKQVDQYRGVAESYGFDADRTILDVRGAQTGPTSISSDEEYDALPSGAQYTGPDGILRVKQ